MPRCSETITIGSREILCFDDARHAAYHYAIYWTEDGKEVALRWES